MDYDAYACAVVSEDMDKAIARSLLRQKLRSLRGLSYETLSTLVSKTMAEEVTGPDGRQYQFETQVFWDDKPDQDIRVFVSIDDGGWRAFVPMTDDFIMSPAGEFVGE